MLDNFFHQKNLYQQKIYLDSIKLFYAERLSMAYQKKLESTSFSALVYTLHLMGFL